MPEHAPVPLICSFESRRSTEMESLIRRAGGRPVLAPSMREIPLTENPEVLQLIDDLQQGEIDAIILMTGVGTLAMLDVAEAVGRRQILLDEMSRRVLIVRGPKPMAVLSKEKLKPTIKVPEPNTWREILQAIRDAGLNLKGTSIVIQEYGIPAVELHNALKSQGADLRSVTVYRWALPEEIGPLTNAIRTICAGAADAVLFTSAQQVRHVQIVAEQNSLWPEFVAASQRCMVASIGPTCSEAIREAGLRVDYEASPPKMGQLVRGVLSGIASAPAAPSTISRPTSR